MWIYVLIFANQALKVRGCSGQPPATTMIPPSTESTTTEYRPDTYPILNEINVGDEVTICPVYFQKCAFTNVNMNVLRGESHVIMAFLDGHTIALVRHKTLHHQGSYLVMYQTLDSNKTLEEATVLYDSNHTRATISWSDYSDSEQLQFHRFVIYPYWKSIHIVAETKKSIFEEPKVNYSRHHPNYGYEQGDDVLTWFYKNAIDLPEKDMALFEKGRKDNATVTQVSVTIKYTASFAKTLGVFFKSGMTQLASYTMMQLQKAFENSRTLIEFKLRCVTLVMLENEDTIGGNDDEKLDTVLGNKAKWRKVGGRINKRRRKGRSTSSEETKERKWAARHSNDLVIAYVHDISSGPGKAFPYQMHLGKSGVMIRFDGAFDAKLLTHLTGHVLGAGHDPHPGQIKDVPIMYYAQAYQSSTSSNICTLMANGFQCKHIPFYSNPSVNYEGREVIGRVNLQDNSRWIKENRFVLSAVGNETLKCSQDFVNNIKVEVVECLVEQSKTFFYAYCDNLEN